MKTLYDNRGRKLGSIDDNGNIRNNEGLYGQKIGSIDDNGNIRNNEGLFGQKIGSIDDNGNIRNNEGLFGQKVGRVEDRESYKKGRGSNGAGVPIPSGGGPLEWIFGIFALYLFYVLFKVVAAIVKGAVFYINAMTWLIKETNAGWIAVIVIVAFILLLKYVDYVAMNANSSSSANESASLSGKIHHTIRGKTIPLIVMAVLLGWGTLSLLALQNYIPLKEDSFGGIEAETFPKEEIKTYRDYMNRLNNTCWYSDTYDVSFSYVPIPNETGYLVDGDAVINEEMYKFYFDIDSLNNEDGYSYAYVLYKGDLDEPDELTYLVYDEYSDTLSDYSALALNRLYSNPAEELKWELIKCKRGGWNLYSFIWHIGNLSIQAKLLFVIALTVFIFLIALPIMLKRRRKKNISIKNKKVNEQSIIKNWFTDEFLHCDRIIERVNDEERMFYFSIYNSTKYSFDKLTFTLDIKNRKTGDKISNANVEVENWPCDSRHYFEVEIRDFGIKEIEISLLPNTLYAKIK